MPVAQIEQFLNELISKEKVWERIRILGGESLIHPDIQIILHMFSKYQRDISPETLLEVATAGHGAHVQSVIEQIPKKIKITNTNKSGQDQVTFAAANIAPCDDPHFVNVDYHNGCRITELCGIALTPYGFYPCVAGAAIDRVFGFDIGLKDLPKNKDRFVQQLGTLCRLCGHFRTGRCIQTAEESMEHSNPQSRTWKEALEKYAKKKPVLIRY